MIEVSGRGQLRLLARRLKDAGQEGQGLRRELLRQMDAAGQPVARQIASLAHLQAYMPARYAAVLAGDLNVHVEKLLARRNPQVSIVAQGRRHRRKLAQREDGILWHPIFGEGPRRSWDWVKVPQTDGMRPGFFTDPCEAAAPDVRQHLLDAMAETARKITAP